MDILDRTFKQAYDLYFQSCLELVKDEKNATKLIDKDCLKKLWLIKLKMDDVEKISISDYLDYVLHIKGVV